MLINKVEKAIAALKQGKLVIICDDDNREAEADLVGIAELATPESVNFMLTHARGVLCAPVSRTIAQQLQLPLMVQNNTDPHKTAFTVSIDLYSSTTGISAPERAATIKHLANPTATGVDFNRPGHIFPLIAKDGGVLVRPGHTEASIDLAKLAGATAAAYICEIMNPDGSMVRRANLQDLAQRHGLEFITVQDIIDYRYKTDNSIVQLQVQVNLPSSFGSFNLHAYSSIVDDKEYLALVKGNPAESKDAVLTRVHSECITGDVFGSYRCDCREQLEKSLHAIEQAQHGVLIYLRQEGRGIGLFNKLKAYELQQNGMDTVEANIALGLPVDARQYGIAASILRQLKVTKIALMTNNPDKVLALQQYGIEVAQRVAIEIAARAENKKYLTSKKDKLQHYLSL